MSSKIPAVAMCGLVFAAGGSPPSSLAQPLVPFSAQMGRCLDAVVDNEHGSRWPAVLICYEDELSSQERRLEIQYARLQAAAPRLGPVALDQIASSRRQWLLYRDGWCGFEQDHAVAPNRDIARLTCRIALTKAQADRVAEQADALR